MRIIAGSAGGIRLQSPKTLARPTTDRVREALFSMLGDQVPGARVLDLFAGSGAFGLEALSRGANQAVMVDDNREAIRTMEANIAKTGLQGARILKQEVERFLRANPFLSDPFQIIFADPPYHKSEGDTDFVSQLLASEHLPQLLTEDGVLIIEVPNPTAEPDVPAWEPVNYRAYGTTGIWLLRKRAEA